MNQFPKSDPKRMKQLTPRRRELMLRVIDGNHTLSHVMFAWNRRQRVEEVLEWLLANRLTGNELSAFITKTWGARFHSAFQWVLQKLDNEKEAPRIFKSDFT